MTLNKKHLGSDFEDYLTEEGVLEETTAVAVKRVLAFQILRAMREQDLSKAALARRMQTSRSSLNRLLDPDFPSVTLLTLERAATALNKKLHIELS
jgi:predicted XRE-type DNA-binding protein